MINFLKDFSILLSFINFLKLEKLYNFTKKV